MEQEQLRHQYLDAIGVASWLPRAALPGAGSSANWVDDFQYPAPEIPFVSERTVSARAGLSDSRQGMKTEAPAVKASASAGVAAARAALGVQPEASPEIESPSATNAHVPSIHDKPSAVVEPISVEAAESTEPVDSISDATPPNFKLMFLRVGELLIVDSMPPQGGVFTEQYAHLATAIAASLGFSGQVSEPFMLPWPMFASKTLNQGRAQAVIAVQHKLNKDLKSQSATALLLLGEAAAQMVLDRRETLDELRGVAFNLQQGVGAVASQSLTELMYLPGAKKALWNDLQTLLAKQG